MNRKWFRVRSGSNSARNENKINYVALMTAHDQELIDGPSRTWLCGRIINMDRPKPRISRIIQNTAMIAGDDAVTILLAVHNQVEGCECGEFAMAQPIHLDEWLRTIFAKEKADLYARMLQMVADGYPKASDDPTL